jgi:hypothetical protein
MLRIHRDIGKSIGELFTSFGAVISADNRTDWRELGAQSHAASRRANGNA